jgi:hypothetical protein
MTFDQAICSYDAPNSSDLRSGQRRTEPDPDMILQVDATEGAIFMTDVGGVDLNDADRRGTFYG